MRNSAAKRKKERKGGGGGKSAQCLAPNTLAVGIANFSHMLPPCFTTPIANKAKFPKKTAENLRVPNFSPFFWEKVR